MRQIQFEAVAGVASAAQGDKADSAVQPIDLEDYTPINTTLRRFADGTTLDDVVVIEDNIVIGNMIYQANVNGMYSDINGKKFGPAWYVTPEMFGAKGDDVNDDTDPVQNSWTYAGANKIMCLMGKGKKYNCFDSVKTVEDLTVHAQGAVMYINDWPAVGGFVNNVYVDPVTGYVETSKCIQKNIYIRDLITDGSKLPHHFQAKSKPTQETNLLSNQSDFSNVSWVKGGVSITANAAKSPYGDMIADRIIEDGSTGNHLVSTTANLAVLTNQMIIHSCYIKGTGDRNVALSLGGTAFASVFSVAVFDLVLNKVVSQSADLYVAEVQKMGDTGWSRCTIAKRSTAGGTYVAGIYMADATGNRNYTGNNNSYLDVCYGFSNVGSSGKNTNLGPEFARGASKVLIESCTARYCRVGIGGGTGGGGFGGEVGLKDIVFLNCNVHDCYRGVRLAGNSADIFTDNPSTPDVVEPDVTQEAANIIFMNTTIRRCGTAIFAHSVGHAGDNESNIKFFDAIFSNTLIESCGHNAFAPVDWILRSTVGGPQKSGVIGMGGSQNIVLNDTRVIIPPTYTTTDLDWLGRSGYPHANWASGLDGYYYAGLSGKVESVIGGWGRNWVVNNIELDGTTESWWNLHRVNPLGDVASSQPTQVVPTELVQQIVMKGLRHVRDNGVPMDYAFKCRAGINNSRVAARLEITPFSALAGGVIDPNAAALSNVDITIVNDIGVSMNGNCLQWNAFGNVLPTTPQKNFYLGGMDWVGGYSPTGARRGVSLSGTDGILRMSSAVTTASTMIALYNANTLVGQIQCTGSATAYATSSDETLKTFNGEYEAENAYDIIKSLPVMKFNWNNSGEAAIGWGAQTAHKVSPDLGILGYWYNPVTGEQCNEHDTWEGDDGTVKAEYMPAGIDQSKYTPYLWAATSKLIDEIEFLKNEISNLKKLH